MSPKVLWQDRVQHLLDAIGEIASFVGGMDRDAFLADPKTIKAVAANLTIIGEAARYIPNQMMQAHPEIPWALMRGMRNRIVHAYYVVDPIIVWETCQNDLAPLVEPLSNLLKTGD